MRTRFLRTLFWVVLPLVLINMAGLHDECYEWGFFGHRRINRMAVFTLPEEMMPFFRHHIEYLTDHAVDPDKRRYATKHEAVRHYIDLDHWGVFPFPEVPREWSEALLRYGEIQILRTGSVDTLKLVATSILRGEEGQDTVLFKTNHPSLPLILPLVEYRQFWRSHVVTQYYEDEWTVAPGTICPLLGMDTTGIAKIIVLDHFSEFGIVPYHLESMQQRLTNAFAKRDATAIIRLAAEMGHYVGDAHVPLHTTENYNGALTNQVGIHAFWESRLPELYADKSYDFFVGKAEYIRNKRDYFWDVVLTSHNLLDSVLAIEKRLSLTIPPDQQYCYEERLGVTIRTQCESYSRAYHEAMNGMVEARMRDAIRSIGDVWFTAWVDAGQPDLTGLLGSNLSAQEIKAQEELERSFQKGEAKGREHGTE